MVECYFMCQSDNGSITDSHPLRRWSNSYIRSLEGIKDPRAPQRLQTLFTAAGFVEIEHTMIPMPLCGWSNGMAKSPSMAKATLQNIWEIWVCYHADFLTSTDPRSRRIGDANRDNIQQALSNLAIFPFTRRLGMAIEDVRALVASACIDAANPGLKAYFPM